MEYIAPSGYESNGKSPANQQQLYDSNYTTDVQQQPKYEEQTYEQPKYDEQSYEQYSQQQQPYDQVDQTYDAGVYDQQQYDQYDQQQYDPQQYDTSNQQYEQYPTTNYDTTPYTTEPAYQPEPQPQPIVNESTLSGYTKPTPSSGTVGQEYTGIARIEPKTPTATATRQQQPQLLPKQSPQA